MFFSKLPDDSQSLFFKDIFTLLSISRYSYLKMACTIATDTIELFSSIFHQFTSIMVCL